MPYVPKSRWTDIPEMREECAQLFEQGLSTGAVLDVLNDKYGARMRKLGYDQLTRNMLIGEKHRERIRERRLSGERIRPKRKGSRAYLMPAEPVAKPPLNVPVWAQSPLFDCIRIKPRETERVEDDDYVEAEQAETF